jgi:hypothetical protein
MTRSVVLSMVIVALVMGCGGQGASPSSPSASATQSGTQFTSTRYGYSIELPPGWYVRGEGPGKWTPFEISYVGAGTDAFEEDYPGRGETMDFPGITYGLYVSAAPPAKPTSLDQWIDTLATTMDAASSCHGTPVRESLTVGGEAAQALVYDRTDCEHDHHVVVVGVLHGDVGYDLLWLAKRGEDDARRETFDSILASWDWTG